MTRYDFPGNVRELETIVFDAVSRSRTGRLTLKEIRDRICSQSNTFDTNLNRPPSADTWYPTSMGERLPTIEEAFSLLIKEALIRCNNNQSEAARLLGISRQRLARNYKNSSN